MSETFSDLSQGLSSDEKKELLARIQQSLNLGFKDTDSIVSKARPHEDLKQRLTKEIQKMSFFRKLLLQISGFFRNRTITDVLVDEKLRDSKDTLTNRIAGCIQPNRDNLTSEMAQRIYDVYAEVAPLKPFFEYVFQQKITLEAGLIHLIQHEYPNALKRLTDIFRLDEIEALYRQDQKKSSLFQELRKRLDDYFAAIPKVVLERVKERLKPLYYFKAIVSYPFAFLFDQFGHNPSKLEIKKYPFFKEAQNRKCADLLERLYFGIYLVTKNEWREGSLNGLFQAVVDTIPSEKKSTILANVDEINHQMAATYRICKTISDEVPWKELLQWCFRDPYYAVKFYLPQFSISDFYRSILEIQVFEELEKTVPHVRKRIYEVEKNRIFSDTPLSYLEFYVAGIPQAAAMYQIRGFRLTETMGLIAAYLTVHFQRKLYPFLQSFTRMAAQSSKNVVLSAQSCAEELLAMREKLVRFDKSLHPEAEDGKELTKYKYELSTKPTSHKPYIQLIQKKDEEAREVYQATIDLLVTLANHLTGLSQKNVPALKQLLKVPYILEGQSESMGTVLERLTTTLRTAIFVVQESYAFEN